MRLALISDIHGNPIALDAVLADVQSQGGVDGYWVLGDLAAIGYDPAGVLERLTGLPNVQFARGNTDRYTVNGDRPYPSQIQAAREPALIPQLVEVAQNFTWTQGALSATGWLDWLAALPLEQRLTLPDGTRMLGVHAAPGTDDGSGLRPALSDGVLAALLEGCEADLVLAGHTHWPFECRVDGVHVVNLGSVSNPITPDLCASYVLLAADEHGYQITYRKVEYDRQAVIAALQRARHPSADFIIRHFEGRHRPHWLQ